MIMSNVVGEIRSCMINYTTAYEMWKYLGTIYDPKLPGAKDAVRQELNALRFFMNGDMEKFIKKKIDCILAQYTILLIFIYSIKQVDVVDVALTLNQVELNSQRHRISS